MPLANRFALTALASIACLAIPLATGCSSKDGSNSASSSDDITQVAETPVKDQSIGNCWTYASTGWIESLVKGANGTDMNLSESYVSYWYWYSQITTGQIDGNTLAEGGTWGEAVELVSTYGIMDEGGFIPEEANAQLSNRQASAVKAMNASLASGALARPQARSNSALVRSELDKAWGLGPAVIKTLDDTFGKDGATPLGTNKVPSEDVLIHRATDLPAKLPNPTTGVLDTVTVADAIGTKRFDDVESRSGTYAWARAYYPAGPSERRQFLKRVQRALHAEQPVLLSWYVDFASLNDKGQFLAPPPAPGSQGSHMVIMYDYEVTSVPGFGTLPAGVLETRPVALEAALSDDAVISFLRIKNSWGNYHSPVIVGYHDLYMAYLNGPLKECATDADEKPLLDQCHDDTPLGDVVLPAGY